MAFGVSASYSACVSDWKLKPSTCAALMVGNRAAASVPLVIVAADRFGIWAVLNARS